MQSFKALVLIIVFSMPAYAAPRVIAALGDSLTQGFGLQQADGFVPQLQAWLQGQGTEISVMNAGVSGDTTAGGLARLDWTLSPEVTGLIVILGGNDFLRGVDPASSRKNLAGILAASAKRDMPVLLVGMPSPRNFGPEYKTEVDRIYPELAAEFGVIYAPNFFAPIMNEATHLPDPAFMQADRIHPNAAGVLRIVEALGPKVLELLGR